MATFFSSNLNKRNYPYRRWALYTFSLITVSLTSGTVYGWPALRRFLIQNDKSNLSEKSLGAIFTAGAWTTQGGRFFFGLIRDRFGTRVAMFMSLMALVIGALSVAFCGANDAVGLAISMGFLGLGSGGQLSMQPVAGLFTKKGSTVLSSLSGAFQISGLVYLALTSISTSRKASFLGYAILILLVLLIGVFILPSGGSFRLNDTKSEPSIQSDEPENNETELENEKTKSSSIQKPPKPSTLSQMRSLEYVLLLFWFSTCIVPLQYYIATIGFQLERKGDEKGTYTNMQQIVYACAAFLSPLVGFLADTIGLGVTQGLATLLCAIAFFLLSSTSIPLNGQAAGLVCYGLGRMVIFGMYFSNIGLRFGFGNYGTLAGFGLVTSAIISLLQYPLIALADDGYEFEVNVGCAVTFLCILPYCAWLGLKERRERIAKSSNVPMKIKSDIENGDGSDPKGAPKE